MLELRCVRRYEQALKSLNSRGNKAHWGSEVCSLTTTRRRYPISRCWNCRHSCFDYCILTLMLSMYWISSFNFRFKSRILSISWLLRVQKQSRGRKSRKSTLPHQHVGTCSCVWFQPARSFNPWVILSLHDSWIRALIHLYQWRRR
jgi:hypothetical protein